MNTTGGEYSGSCDGFWSENHLAVSTRQAEELGNNDLVSVI